MGINFDASSFLSGMTEANLKMRFAVEKYGETAAKKLEAYAKENRPWTDRTSNARNSIQGFSGWGEVSGNVTLEETGETKKGETKYKSSGFNTTSQGGSGKMMVGVSGNMEYSPYLELAGEKQYAILWPTIQAMEAELVQGMHKLLDK